MAVEREIKLKIDTPEGLRARLVSAGAAAEPAVLEVSRIFDTPQRELFASDRGLRLRTSTPVDGLGEEADATLTYKGPRDAASALKSREEHEVRVENAAVMGEIVRALGYTEVVLYEKRRETYALGGCAVSLDELPGMGWYCEIEGQSQAAIERVRASLELDGAEVVDDTYVHIAAKHGKLDETGRRALRFE